MLPCMWKWQCVSLSFSHKKILQLQSLSLLAHLLRERDPKQLCGEAMYREELGPPVNSQHQLSSHLSESWKSLASGSLAQCWKQTFSLGISPGWHLNSNFPAELDSKLPALLHQNLWLTKIVGNMNVYCSFTPLSIGVIGYTAVENPDTSCVLGRLPREEGSEKHLRVTKWEGSMSFSHFWVSREPTLSGKYTNKHRSCQIHGFWQSVQCFWCCQKFGVSNVIRKNIKELPLYYTGETKRSMGD